MKSNIQGCPVTGVLTIGNESVKKIENNKSVKMAMKITEELICEIIQNRILWNNSYQCGETLNKTIRRLSKYFTVLQTRLPLLIEPSKFAYTNFELIVYSKIFVFQINGDIDIIRQQINEITEDIDLCLHILELIIIFNYDTISSDFLKKANFLKLQLSKDSTIK